MRLFAVTLFAVLALASPAFASQVTNVTLDNSVPSPAASALTIYKVGFTATTALSGANSGSITVTFPAGTSFPDWGGGTIARGATGLGGCGTPVGLTVTCPLNFSSSIAANDAIVVTLRGVTNPGVTGPITARVTTTSDTDQATSANAAAVVTAGAVGTPVVINTQPSAAAGARTVYLVDFDLSATGGLAGEAGSRINLTLPAGTTYSGFGATITDTTTATNLGGCNTPSGLTITCSLNSSANAAAGHHIRMTLRGIVNGAVGTTKQVSVATTTDLPVTPSLNFSVVGGNPVTNVGVNNASPSAAAGARTLYLVDFTLSATGGLDGEANSQINLTMPAGTTYSGFGATITDTTTSTNLGGCNTPSGLSITCSLNFSATAAAGDQMRITLRGVVNGAVGTTKQVAVSTTSDLPTVQSGNFEIVAPNAVSNVTVDDTVPSAAAGARTVYLVEFTLSATGGLDGEANSQINLIMPAGTTYSGFGATITDTTSSTNLGGCNTPSGLNITCSLNFSSTAAAGHRLRLTLRGVVNGPTGTAKTVKVNTTTDLPNVDSSPFAVVDGHAVSAVAVDLATPSSAAGARNRYVVDFTLSETGGLAGEANSVITLAMPAGTTFGSGFSATVTDVTDATTLGGCNSPSGLNIPCSLNFSAKADPGDRVRVTLRGVINGPAGAGRQVSVTTTSDLPSSSSPPFAIVPGQPVSGVNVIAPTTASATGQYVVAFTTSSTGGLSGEAGSSVDVTFPAGTTFPAGFSGTIRRGGTAIGSCTQPAGLVTRCTLNFSWASLAGDQLKIVFATITNPASAGPYTLTVTTTTDLPAVTSSPYAAAPLDTAITSGPATPSDDTTPTFTFTGNGTGFQCRVDAAAFAACTSPYTSATLSLGTHTFQVRAVDGAGGSDQTPDSQTFVIATAELDTTITSGPANPGNDTTPTFTFTGNGTGFECRVDTAGFAACTSPFTTAALSEGSHSFEVRARDAAGTVDESPATRTFAIDTTPPDTTLSPASAPPFTFGGGTSFECSLDDGPFAACAAPYTPPPLAPGEHKLTVRAVDAAGNRDATPSVLTFTVAAPTPTPVATAIATVAPTPSPTPTPTPTFKKDVVASPASGTVSICDKPGGKCKVLAAGAEIPMGSTVDARKGVVVITSIAAAGAPPQSARFYDGMFKVTQTGSTTDLTLNEPLAPCSSKKARAAAKKPKSRKLWGDGKGKFRTRGQYGAATIRGTKWLVQDSCAGTLVKVDQGVVSVEDYARRKTVTVRAKKSYTAKPRRR